MNIIILLLAVIALSEVSRLFLTHRKSSKKQHFKQKLEGTRKMLWDFEFKLFKTRELREEIRVEYDFMKSRVDTLQKQYDTLPKGKDAEAKEGIKDQLTLAERDRDRLEGQIKGLDLEMNGSKPNSQYPDGVQGITSQIEALREVEGLLKNYLKEI